MLKMRSALALATAATMVFGLAACGTGSTTATTAASSAAQTTAAETTKEAAGAGTIAAAGGSGTEIKLWTFPIGKWGGDYVTEAITAFNKQNPDIKVNVEYLDYKSGDDQLTAAIEAGTAPDILMAEPLRLVKYGKNGQMVKMNDLFTDDLKKDIGNDSIVAACSDGTDYWMYPLSITAHFMAINKEAWEKSGAMEFVNQEGDRTWTTDNFVKALGKLKDAGLTSGVVYCGGQGGDQGTRALADNLYSAEFTNKDHTEWTMNSANGVKGLQELKDLCDQGLLTYDAGIAASDELQLFSNGTVQMTICWNASNAANYAKSVAFTPYALPFPSDDGKPVLESGLFGFGIFNNKDDAKAEAAKKFIQFVSDDAEIGPKSVEATGFFPVRSSFKCHADSTDPEMTFYKAMLPYVGDNFTAMDGFTEQRKEWWTMLQNIFSGEKTVEDAANTYVTNSNGFTASYKKA